MGDHFGKGLLAGLKAENLKPETELSRFCSDYKRGFVLGYAHHLAQRCGDENRAAFEAGQLSRAYGLGSEPMSEFFSGGDSRLAESFSAPAITGRRRASAGGASGGAQHRHHIHARLVALVFKAAVRRWAELQAVSLGHVMARVTFHKDQLAG